MRCARSSVARTHALVDPLTLEPQHVVELLLDVLEDVVEAVPLELLLTLFAQPLHQLLEAGELPPIPVAPALAQEAAQRGLEVPAVEDVLAQAVEERVGVIAERVLGAVPHRESVSPGRAGVVPPRVRWCHDVACGFLPRHVSVSGHSAPVHRAAPGGLRGSPPHAIRHRRRFRRVPSC